MGVSRRADRSGVAWDRAAMQPRTVDHGFYCYRTNQLFTSAQITMEDQEARHLREIGNPDNDELLKFVGMYQYMRETSSDPRTIEPTEPTDVSKDEHLNYVCGLTPYYMIGEVDPKSATAQDLKSEQVSLGEAVSNAIGDPVGPNSPVISLLDTGYLPLHMINEVEAVVQVIGGQLASAVIQPLTDKLVERAVGHGRFVSSIAAVTAGRAVMQFEQAREPIDGVVDEHSISTQLLQAARGSDLGDQQAAIINISLGCYSRDDKPPRLLTETVKKVLSEDPRLVIVAAAGNDASQRPLWPAGLGRTFEHSSDPEERALASRIVAVGAHRGRWSNRDTALNATPSITEFSNHGPHVAWFAPGEDVKGAYLGEKGRPVERENVNSGGSRSFTGAATWSGTSFAAPYIAGLIARVMQVEDCSAAEAWAWLSGDSERATCARQQLGLIHRDSFPPRATAEAS